MRFRSPGLHVSIATLSCVVAIFASTAQAQVWQSYAKNSQHTAQSGVQSQALNTIVWNTPVDLAPQYEDNELFIHYGSPLVTATNTVIVPVKTGADDGFEVQARRGSDGMLLWTQSTDYTLPAHGWVPSYSPVLTPQGRLYWPGGGGSLLYRSSVDVPGAVIPHRVNFYLNKKHKFSSASVSICTPLTTDANGAIFFGFEVSGTAPTNLGIGGIARIDSNGKGRFITLKDKTGLQLQPTFNCAPALSQNGRTLYMTAHGTAFIRNGQNGYLIALDSASLRVQNMVLLADPSNGGVATLLDDGTASPTVGPDGKVYIGVLDNPITTGKGWLLQFSGDLSQSTGVPGAFGWDDTVSIVPAPMVPSYQGSSSYLLMTKYNNYAEFGGGDGLNRLAILDPNDSQTDVRTGVTVMKEVLTILGPTPDPEFDSQFPGAVREWCINNAVVDPLSGSVLANSEDGKLYRWDLTTNTFTQVITLTSGIGEAYTPTVIGGDGKVYAINNATLFAVGQ
jgi:hypothetical protein